MVKCMYMTAKKYNEKMEKLLRDMVRRKPSKSEAERQRQAWKQLGGIWADNPRTEEDLKRVRRIIWGE